MELQLKTVLGDLIFEGDFSSVAELVTAALSAKKSLRSADLSSANLSYANLSSANLSSANLSSANLSSANLSSANLSSANLSYADLSSANLSSANLRSANLRSANLSYADLSSANLSSADLRSADLSSANLRSANLSSANLSYANLSSANLSSANLSYADLSSAKNSEFAVALTRILPEGSLIGWKQCRDNVIVKLRIPEDAKRSHAFGRKCRAEFVEVLEVIGAEVGVSSYDANVTYVKGARVTPKEPFNLDFTNECSSGIHFFITRLEAEKYDL